jgi:hypothetical protein
MQTTFNRSDNKIYVAGTKSGLTTVDENLTINNMFNDSSQIVDVIEFNGRIIFLTNDRRVFSSLNGSIKLIKKLSNLTQTTYARKLLILDDNLYIATNNGIFNFNDNSIFYSGIDSDLNSANVYDALTVNGQYVIATYNGLYKMDANGVVKKINLAIPNGLSIYVLLKDQYDQIWLGTNHGLIVLDKELKARKYLNKYDGLLSNEINRGALKELSDDAIYIGTDKGLSIYRHYYDEIPKNEPKIRLHFDNYLFKESNFYVYAYSDPIKFRYDLTSYYAVNSQKYQYRILNSKDEAWVNINRYDVDGAYILDLNPGNYTLQVRSKNKNTDWIISNYEYPIRVNASFYTSVWFYIILLVLFLVFVYLSIKYFELKALKRTISGDNQDQ